jgi:thioredoxin reductase (NADPH)
MNDASSATFDMIIVGAGPSGLACSIAAQAAGLAHLVLDKGSVVNTIYRLPTDMLLFSTPDRLAIGDVPFSCPDKKPSRAQVVTYYREVARHFRLPIRQNQKVTNISRRGDRFTLDLTATTGDYQLSARTVVVATGFYDSPVRVRVPGADSAKCHYYFQDGHPYFQQRVAVVGGGNSAVETALELYRCGAEVSLIHRGAELREGVKYWVRPEIENRIARGEVSAYFGATVAEVRPGELAIDTASGTSTLANDAVIFQLGYRPTDQLLQQLGVGSDRSTEAPRFDADTLETDQPGVFVCGVVTAGAAAGTVLVEAGRFHGQRIVARVRDLLAAAGAGAG